MLDYLLRIIYKMSGAFSAKLFFLKSLFFVIIYCVYKGQKDG